MTSPISRRLRGRLSQSVSLHYQAFPAITHGIQFLDRNMPYLPQRLAALHHWLRESLSSLLYPNNSPFVRILTGPPERVAPLRTPPYTLGTTHLMTPPSTPAFVPPTPSSYFVRRKGSLPDTSSGGRASTDCSAASTLLAASAWGSSVSDMPLQGTYGYIITCVFLSPSGKRLCPAHVSKRAARHKIHLSTGYMCTSSGTRGNRPHGGFTPDGQSTCDDAASNEMVVRMSLGIGSDFEDVWNVLRWAKNFLEEEMLGCELVSWRSAPASRPLLHPEHKS